MNGLEENITGPASGESPLIAVSDFPQLWKDYKQEDFQLTKTSLTKKDVTEELNVPSAIATELENVCRYLCIVIKFVN